LSTDLTVWLAGILTLCAYSFLYKENPFYRLAEYLLVGVGAGYALVVGWTNILQKAIQPLQKGQIAVLIPVVLGLLLFTRFSRKQAWLSRYPIALMVCIGAAVALSGTIKEQLIKQIGATMLPLNSFDNIVFVAGVVTVLSYFFFTFKPTTAIQRGSALVGRSFLMVAFGSMVGSVAMLRTSLLIGRIDFVFKQWFHILK